VPDYEAVTKDVMRPDIYEEAMKEIGYKHGGVSDTPEAFFDGTTFDPTKDLDAFAKSFAINSIKG
jgi:nitrate/nitrite transport system substrate-binding protein